MDALPAFGTNIGGSIPGTIATYVPLLSAKAAAIRSTPVKTYSYGPTPRHQLDHYTPAAGARPNAPILVFVHGGGFVNGSKNLPFGGGGLAYANLGHFFAEHFGFDVVIPDYRLISHGARFPSGGEDVALVVEWIVKTLGAEGQAGQRELLLAGNSAGGAHVSTFLFAKEFLETRRKVTELAAQSGINLTRVAELSVPFDFEEFDPARIEVINAYFGSKEQCALDAPTGLLKRAQPMQSELKDVKFLVTYEELDPQDEILDPVKRFMEAWAGTKPETLYVAGHNHISPVLGLGTGIEREEKWGFDVGKWLQGKP